MSWICVAPNVICLCPSPVEAVKSGVISIVDAVQGGVATVNEAQMSVKNFIGRKVTELKETIGETVERISDISDDLFDQFVAPIIEKVKEWVKFIFEMILNGANILLKTVSTAVFSASKWVYKRIFKVALGLEDFGDLAREILNALLGLLGTNLDEAEDYLKKTEPFKTILPLFDTLQEIFETIQVFVNPQKLLQDLIDTHLRPVIINYFKDLLPLEKIPIPDVENLVLNVAFDNIFNVEQLFGNPTAGISKSMENIVEWLIKISMKSITSAKPEEGSEVPGWTWDLLATLLTLEGIVVGLITLHPSFPSAGGATKVGQVGTALTVVGIVLSELNILNTTANAATSGRIDKQLEEQLNGIKAGKDLAISNSTAMVLTCAGLVIQLTGGATPYEYIATALSFLTSIGGLLCALGAGNIQSDPILVAMAEIYEEHYADESSGEPKGVVNGAKQNLLPADPRIDELYADYEEPVITTAKPVITVDTPWYGPQIINYCFVNREYARQVAKDFIDEMGNVKGMWLSVRVRNTGLASTRINMNFFYSIANGPLQSIKDVTFNKQEGDLLNPQETRDYWYQEWNFSRSEAADLCRGKYTVSAVASVKGAFNESKSQLQNSVKLWIPPHFEIEPITVSSSGSVRSKIFNETSLPLVREGDIITLSSKLKNTGGKFEAHKSICVRWYIDDGAGKLIVIAKQMYNSLDGTNFHFGEEIPIDFTLDTTNLGLSSYGVEGWIRHFKVAVLKADFENCVGENLPLFSNKQEAEIHIAFDPWFPECARPQLSVSNQNPIEGETLVFSTLLHNVGKTAVNLRNGTLKVEELAIDGRSILRSFSPDLEFARTNFNSVAFDAGDSNTGQSCERMSFVFTPSTDIWVDAIKVRPAPGTTESVICGSIKIIYLGYIISTVSVRSSDTGIHFFENPVLLQAGNRYHFEFEGIRGTPMVGTRDYRLGTRDIITNGVVTIKGLEFIHAHPKIKLYCLKTLPPGGEGSLDLNWSSQGKLTTGFLAWRFTSTAQNVNLYERIEVNVRERELKAFRLYCETPAMVMGRVRVLEYPIVVSKEEDVQEISIEIIPSKASNQFIIYIREFDQESSDPVNKIQVNLQDSNPREFIVGIVASKNIPIGTASSFSIKGTAHIERKKIEKTIVLQFTVGSDYTEIFDFNCGDARREIRGDSETEYSLRLYNKSQKHLTLQIQAEGLANADPEKWDYYFSAPKEKYLPLELNNVAEDIKFLVISKEGTQTIEIRNQLKASYCWDPTKTGSADYCLEKVVDLQTIFLEKPSPLAMILRTSPNAADPGIIIRLTTQLTVYPSAEKDFYNISLTVDGNLDFINRPKRAWQLKRGETQSIIWDARIPEKVPIGSTIPVKVTAALTEEKRTISVIRDIKVTNNRKEFEFALKTDWKMLSVIQGKQATLKLIIENTGRKVDRVDLRITQGLPAGWFLTPNSKTLVTTPDEQVILQIYIQSPASAKVGEGGSLTIVASSRGDANITQMKQVTVKAVAPGPKWSIDLEVDKLKKAVKATKDTIFLISVTNSGNRPLGEVELRIKHNYHQVQFETEMTPKKLNLRTPGTTGTASAIIRPRITGPGTYKFELIARWQEGILYAQEMKQLRIDYATQTFLRSKYGIITIGIVAVIITAVILVLRFLP